MKNNRHIHEEALIDFLLGNVSAERAKEINKHIAQCTQCEQLQNEWRGLLDKTVELHPRQELKEEIWTSRLKRQSPNEKRLQRVYVTAIASAAAVLLMFFGLLISERDSQEKYEVALNEEIAIQTIVHNPLTEQLAIVPVADFHHVSGNLWFNGPQQEILLEVDGLMNISNRDYQLWLIYDNDEIKGEVLTTKNGVSRVYIKGNDVNHFKLIKASVEPIGGSQVPTGPETFFVPIKDSR